MLDFLMVSVKSSKRGVIEIYPKFIINNKSSDLMIRGGDFYAIWNAETKLWSTDEQDAIKLIDKEIDNYYEANKSKWNDNVKLLHMWDAESGMIDAWHKYCQKQLRDSYHQLDDNLTFSNIETKKTDYASKKLQYPIVDEPTPAYDELMSVLYSDEERRKIEWAIGSIINGDSKKIQKFLVLYGSSGTGKSTVLNIIQQLFDGYYSVFDAKALGTANNSFALEAFKSNPLVAIQHDGDLSKIEDNTRLNSLVSHELMTVNEKFKSTYSNRFKSFLFMGTNKPVKITDAKSGLLRRLIDVSPTGNKLPYADYKRLTKQIGFELGGIAKKCLDVYNEDPDYYNDYIPVSMMSASNDFYNFILDSYDVFKEQDGTTLKAAWEMYKVYCEDAKVPYPLSQRIFKEELKNYFKKFEERAYQDDLRVRNYYSVFSLNTDNNQAKKESPNKVVKKGDLELIYTNSILDKELADCPAQYANENGTPRYSWRNVDTTLKDIDTSKLHYVKIPQNHIVIDFDIKDENGEKSRDKNIAEASKWPLTYAEYSKSGKGVHLHYIYSGDVSLLNPKYSDDIEIKVFTGNSSLRRMVTYCNNLPIATISSGLPIKEGGDKVINSDSVKSERSLRQLITRNLHKEIHPGTKPSIDFIYKILEDAYKSSLKYDVSDMYNEILAFAAGSTHQADYCIKLVGKMHLKSEEPSAETDIPVSDKIAFYDVEIFPNLFLVCWKFAGEDQPVQKMFNPTPAEIENLLKLKLVGFNCRRYDNHILYARLMGYTNEQLFNLSDKIINSGKNCFFGEAYNLSYTDVYDFSSKKQSLKKFEIDLGIHHQELEFPWNEPVDEKLWDKVAEYCCNDVIATEAVFNDRKADFTARKILADVADMTVNDTTNSLTTRIIFGTDRHPQEHFNYRFMGNAPYYDERDKYEVFDNKGVPWFPDYKFDKGKSFYRGEEVGEGGYVYAEPGIYTNVALLDIASMHPSSIIAENLFGTEYTKRFKDILDARLAIKHKDFAKAKKMLGGKLAPYLEDEKQVKDLSQALKIAINSVYGLTSAKFDNPFRDIRNIDNIVAKRGALFMINLKHAVQEKGFTVAHIKTDSIKIPNATKDIIDFVMEYGKKYGYNFEHEATYEKLCLVNDAVYIAKEENGEWTATGTQFAVPYVFKTLFSHEPIEFKDMCETKSVTTSLYLDMNEGLGEDEHAYKFVGKVGLFCPIKAGKGGGKLYREKDGKYYSVTGTKGYSWLEAEVVRELHKEDDIDISYYEKLVNDAKSAISKYGDFDWFVSNDKIEPIESDPLPEDLLYY